MSEITALISEEDVVLLQGIPFTEKREMWHLLQKILNDDPGCTITIDSTDIKFYRAMAKIIYAVNMAGFEEQAVTIKAAGEYIKRQDQVIRPGTPPFFE